MFCPLCQERKTEYLWETENRHGRWSVSKERIVVLKCQHCGLVFPRVRVRPNFYQKYYPTKYHFSGRSFISYLEEKYSRLCFYQALKLVRCSLPGGGKLLDFGCGRGQFLAFLPKSYQGYGVEINPQALRLIKKNYPRLKVYPQLSSIKPQSLKFDLITLWHVLEHLPNPQKTLRELKKRLTKNGKIIVATPNTDSWGFKISRENWFHLDAPRHLFIFNLKNLISLFQAEGLRVISVTASRVEYPLDLFWSLKSRLKSSLIALPLSLGLKLIYSFFPGRAEIITLVAKK